MFACVAPPATPLAAHRRVFFFRSASASIWVGGAMLWWLPLAAAQCAIILHARAMHNSAPAAKEYKKVETSSSTDEDDLEADLGDLEPKLADPVAEQNRLLSEKPIYAEDAPTAHSKLIDLGLGPAPPAPPEPEAPPVVHEPVGQLAFQQMTLFPDHSSESGPDSFEASVARAMAAEEESSH